MTGLASLALRRWSGDWGRFLRNSPRQHRIVSYLLKKFLISMDYTMRKVMIHKDDTHGILLRLSKTRFLWCRIKTLTTQTTPHSTAMQTRYTRFIETTDKTEVNSRCLNPFQQVMPLVYFHTDDFCDINRLEPSTAGPSQAHSNLTQI